MTEPSIIKNVEDPLRLHLSQKYVKCGKKWQSLVNLPMGGCVTPVSVMPDVWDSLGLHLNQKVLKSDKKRPSCGQFTNGRLRDSRLS